MLHDRLEDLNGAHGATIRYLVQSVSKNTVQSTLATLWQYCEKSVEYCRYTIKSVIGALLAAPSKERGMLAQSLVSQALALPNGLTRVATALDEAPVAMTRETLGNFMSSELRLSPQEQLQFATALMLGGGKSAAAAGAEFVANFTVSPTLLKNNEAALRGCAMLTRVTGNAETATTTALQAQLAPVCHLQNVAIVPTGLGERRHHVSLAHVLRELGTGCVTTLADSRELLSIFPYPFTELDVSEVLGFFAAQGTAVNDSNTYTSLMLALGRPASRNVGGTSVVVNAMPLLDALHDNRNFDWVKIIRLLDQPGEETFRLKNISVIFDAYYKYKSGNEYPAITLFLGRWQHVGRQRCALEYILRHPERVNRKALVADPLAETLSTPRPANMSAAELDLWRSRAFVEAAIHVASRERDFDTDVLRPAMDKLPLLFLHMLLGRYDGTIKNFTAMKYLITTHCPPLDQVAALIVPAAEQSGRLEALIGVFSELTLVLPGRTIEVMEMVLKSKNMARQFLKSSVSPRLVTAIAMCMDEAGESSDKWLQNALEGKLYFRTSATENRMAVAMSLVEVAEMLLEKQVYVASATAALNLLLASPMKETLRSLADCARGLLAASNSLFSEDVENAATEVFKKMYAEGHTATAIATIEQLLKSSEARDKQLYACIVTILFDESSAITCYPRKELQLFAALYGQLLARELLPPNQQQRAWGLLLPAILKPQNHAVEEYGVIALEQLKPRIAQWPHYCRALRQIKDLDFRVPGIMAAINRGIRQDEASKAQEAAASSNHHRGDESPRGTRVNGNAAGLAAVDPAIVAAAGPNGEGTEITNTNNNNTESGSPPPPQSVVAKLHTHDIGTLLTNRKITAPPRVIQEQINFLIGNTDIEKLDGNARELGQLLRPEYYEYFADYLVVMRAALEPNYHAMYLDLVSKLHSKELDKALRTATIAAVKRLLASDKIRSDSNERFLLRNLGAWLGSITLEKSIPILQIDLDFRDFIHRGLREGKLIAVVSLLTRVLNSCVKSRFFCPPNPWTMAQLCLLLEMYQLPHLKLTLRFEVELICKHLEVTLGDVAQYMQAHPSFAATRVRLEDIYREIDPHESPDFRVEEGAETTTANIAASAGLPDALKRQMSPSAPQQLALAQMRSNVRPLQASAEPFQPKDAAALQQQQQSVPPPPPPPTTATTTGAAAPSSGTPNLQPLLEQLEMPLRPPILITAESVHVGMEEQVMDSRIAEYRQSLAATLESVVEECYKQLASRAVAVAVATTLSIVLKDYTRDPAAEELLLAAEAMSRSLAANLCFATAREEMLGLLRQRVAMLADRIFDPTVTAELNAALRASILEHNEDLCMRALEYRAGEAAANELRPKLVNAIYERTRAASKNEPLRIPKDQIAANELLLVMGEELVPYGRMPPPQRDVYLDFFNCMPAVSLFTIYLRSVEEAVSKHYAMDNPAVLDMSSPQFAQENVSESHHLIRHRTSATLYLITSETAIYYVGPVFHKLIGLPITMDRLNRELRSRGAEAVGLDAIQNARSVNIAALLNQIYLLILQTCVERGGEAVREEFTRIYLKHDHRYAFSKLTVDLIRIKILNFSRLDEDLAKELASGAPHCVNYAGEMISAVILTDKLVSSRDMRRTLTALDVISRSRNVQRAAQAVAPSPAHVTTPALIKLVAPDVTTLVLPLPHVVEESQRRVADLLEEWIHMWSRKGHRQQGEERNPSVDFVKTLQQHGMLDTTRLAIFLEMSIRLCVEHYATVSLEMEREQEQQEKEKEDGSAKSTTMGAKPGAPPAHRLPHSTRLFVKCDAFADLVLVLLRCCSLRSDASREPQRAETTLLRRVLDNFVRVLATHHESVATQHFPQDELPPHTEYIPIFQQQPYVRLLSNLMIMIQRQESAAQRSISNEITLVIQSALHRLQPLEFPAFAFGWLELVAHRIFIPRCMRPEELWGRYTELLVDGLRFIEVLTRGHAISPNGLVFYKAFFKLMLILLHDYPQFLIAQHFPICDAIPTYCVQMLNTVLCSFPPELHLPEPFHRATGDLEDMLKPINTAVQVAHIRGVFAEAAKDGFDISPITRYVAKSNEVIPEPVMKKLLDRLNESTGNPNSLMNAVVLHVAITYLEAHNNVLDATFVNNNAVRLFKYLAQHLSTKQRYHFLCACACHLRFPNIQTNFFAKIFFLLFLPDPAIDIHTQTRIQEQITRVVAEKTVIVQPHPWGVLNTFVELMRNPIFHFWEKSFVHTPQLEGIFTRLRRTVETRNGAQNAATHAMPPAAQSPPSVNNTRGRAPS